MKPSVKPPLPFSRLSAIEKRRAIARDVLLLLRAKRLKPKKGTYVVAHRAEAVAHEIDLQKVMLDKATKCTVCAYGAAIVGMAIKQDRVTLTRDPFIRGEINWKGVQDPLFKIFGQPLMLDIEGAFEGWTHRHKLNDEFLFKYPSATTRLRIIYQQIAKTGTFDITLVKGLS